MKYPIRKITATVIAVAISGAAVPLLNAGFAAETPVTSAGYDYSSCIERLRGLGAIDYDGTADLTRNVTRGEFADMIVKYFRYESMTSGDIATTPFIDVSLDNAHIRSIRLLYDMGYISGSADRCFYPDEYITARDVLVVMVSALGYKFEAVANGGYPDGYTGVAYAKEIIKDISPSFTEAIKSGDIYKIFDDSLEVPIMKQTMSEGNISYTSTDDDTVLRLYYRAEKRDGKITANKYTSLTDPEAGTGKNQISISDGIYDTDIDKDYSDMLGKEVEYYVSTDDEQKIIYLRNKSNKNYEDTISATDILSISSSYITYQHEEQDAARKQIKVSSSADIIYNGKAYTGYGSVENISLKSGNVRTLDSDGDNSADVIFITEYEDYYVSAIDKSNKIIYDYENKVNFDFDTDVNTLEVYENDGTKSKFSALKTGDIVSLAASKNSGAKLIRAYRTNSIVSGTVTAINDDEITVNGTAYKRAYNYTKEIKAGDSLDFYLDIEGKIAQSFSSVSKDYSYAVVYRSWEDESGTFASVKLYDASDKIKTYNFAATSSLDDKTLKMGQSANIVKMIAALAKGTVIRYKVNEENLIIEVDTPEPLQTDAAGNSYPADTEDFRVLYSGSSFKYRSNLFDGKVIADKNTVIFGIPTQSNWDTTSSFSKLTTGSFSGGSSYTKNYAAYGIGKKDINIANVITVEGMTKGAMSNTTNLSFVTGTAEGIDGDGNTCRIIKAVSGGNITEYQTDPDSTLISDYNIRRGDVIRVGTDSTGQVNAVQKVYNADGSSGYGALLVPDEGVSENTSSFDGEYRVIIGTVEGIEDGYIKTELKKVSSGTFYTTDSICLLSGAKIIRYDSTNTKKTIPDTCTEKDIIKGDTVIIRMNLAAAQEVIILR